MSSKSDSFSCSFILTFPFAELKTLTAITDESLLIDCLDFLRGVTKYHSLVVWFCCLFHILFVESAVCVISSYINEYK